MNLAKKSIVQKYSKDSVEYSIVQDICRAHTRSTMENEQITRSDFVGVLQNVSPPEAS